MKSSLRHFLLSTATTVSFLGGGYTAYGTWIPAVDAGIMVLNTAVLPIGNAPLAVPNGDRVRVAWRASADYDELPALSYVVTRYGSGTATEACVSLATTCRELAVPAGVWTYTVRPDLGPWRGRESVPGPPVTVSAGSVAIVGDEGDSTIASRGSPSPGMPSPAREEPPTVRAVEAIGDRSPPVTEPERGAVREAQEPPNGPVAVESSAPRPVLGDAGSPIS